MFLQDGMDAESLFQQGSIETYVMTADGLRRLDEDDQQDDDLYYGKGIGMYERAGHVIECLGALTDIDPDDSERAAEPDTSAQLRDRKPPASPAAAAVSKLAPSAKSLATINQASKSPAQQSSSSASPVLSSSPMDAAGTAAATPSKAASDDLDDVLASLMHAQRRLLKIMAEKGWYMWQWYLIGQHGVYATCLNLDCRSNRKRSPCRQSTGKQLRGAYAIKCASSATIPISR